jgi:regulator of CtrA degradation
MLVGSEDRVPEWNAAGQWETAVSEPDLLRNRNKSERDPVAFGTTFVRSDAFKIVFREARGLIEDTAAYLDGPGRDESRRLPRQAALAYASESMRLTTRLMQIASWLLVQRAVAKGEITPAQAASERRRVRLTKQEVATPLCEFDLLPERLRSLVGLSLRLHARMLHLDRLTNHDAPASVPRANPVAMQQWLIRSAFDPVS